jgi:hypothetical protein
MGMDGSKNPPAERGAGFGAGLVARLVAATTMGWAAAFCQNSSTATFPFPAGFLMYSSRTCVARSRRRTKATLACAESIGAQLWIATVAVSEGGRALQRPTGSHDLMEPPELSSHGTTGEDRVALQAIIEHLGYSFSG